jgi:hypothetical protein
MERRDALRSLAATGAALVLPGCRKPAASAAVVTDADVDRMIRTLSGVDPASGDLAPTRALLASFRFKGTVEPGVQPALAFDPEVDLE